MILSDPEQGRSRGRINPQTMDTNALFPSCQATFYGCGAVQNLSQVEGCDCAIISFWEGGSLQRQADAFQLNN
jgi:hypothetical protein